MIVQVDISKSWEVLTPTMKNKLITPHKLGEILGVSRRTLRRYEIAGILNPVKINQRVVRFTEENVDQLIEQFSRS